MVELVIVDRLHHTQEEVGQGYLANHTWVVGPLVCLEHRRAEEVGPQAQAVHFDREVGPQAVHFDREVGPQVVHFDREVVPNFEDISQADFVGEASTPVGPEIKGISLSDFVEKKSDCSTEGIIAKVGFVVEAFILTVVEVDIMQATTAGKDIATTITVEVGTVAVQAIIGVDTITAATEVGTITAATEVGTITAATEVGTGQEDTTSIGQVVKLVAFLINKLINNNLTFYLTGY